MPGPLCAVVAFVGHLADPLATRPQNIIIVWSSVNGHEAAFTY